MNPHFVIIGAGPAGEAAAKTIVNQSKKRNEAVRLSLIEKADAGGLCLNKGCIPSKTLLEQVHARLHQLDTFSWDHLQAVKNEVVSGLRDQLERSLKSPNVNLIKGTAAFESPDAIQVRTPNGPVSLQFDKALIATGTAIYFPPPLDQYKDDLLTSDKILNLTQTPDSIVVVGGGAVGLEFACLLNALGSTVSVVELKPAILPGEDPFVVSTLTKILSARGIKIYSGVKVKTLEKKEAGWKITLSNEETIESQDILASVGRFPNPAALDCEKAGIEHDNRSFKLNDRLQTTNPRVYAAGDAATTRLAHAAAAQAHVAANNMLGATDTFDDQWIPRCLYGWPEVASVGLWKYEAEQKNIPVKTSRAYYKGSSKALAAGDTDGFVQLVAHADTGRLLGAQMIGAHATELIHIISVALKAGMIKQELSEVMFAHPTLSEMIKDACLK